MADGSIILDTRINNKGAYAELKELQANVLNAVRENMAAEEAAAANIIETPKTEEEKMPN